MNIFKQQSDCCTRSFPVPSPLSHTNTRRQILWLWHTHSGRWRVSLFSLSASVPPDFTYVATYTRRNWTNHLQVCSVFDALLQHANLLLLNNQARFELPFPPVALTWRSVHHAGEKNWWAAEHLTKHLVLPCTILSSTTSKNNLIFFFPFHPQFQRNWKRSKTMLPDNSSSPQ